MDKLLNGLLNRMINRLKNWYFTKDALPYWYVLLVDCGIVMMAGYISLFLEMGLRPFLGSFGLITLMVVGITAIFVCFFRCYHTYSGVLLYSAFVDLIQVAKANATASVVILVLLHISRTVHVFEVTPFRYISIVLIFGIATLVMWIERIMAKNLYDSLNVESKVKKAFIYGVREGAVGIAKAVIGSVPRRFLIEGFVSPNGDFESKYLMGVKVFRNNEHLVKHMKKRGVKVMIVSPLQIEGFRENDWLINELTENGIKIFVTQNAEEWDKKSEIAQSSIHEVHIEDLLPRDQIKVDMDAIGDLLRGKCILITGAAGSIGSEMVRQIAPYKPSKMVLIDQAETPMHDVRLMMARQFGDISAETIVGSITNKDFMESIFAEYRPEYVFHAAAYKHVPMMEDNPAMAVQNNIYGTRVIADLAVKYQTKKFVMISTDKAVNPTNVMGCSKRICEIYCQSLNKAIVDGEVEGVTQFVTTRFGNVLGSNGSVIPIFREQIKNGGPITVTHPEIIRFFMLIPEACKLVLEAGTMGKGGEIFVFDMGKPVRIVDLAKRMIKLSGATDIDIVFTGLREGEKLYEEVLSDKEQTLPTMHPKIMVAKVREYDYREASANEERLLEASHGYDDMAIVRIMKEIVPEYVSRESKFCVLDKE